MKTAYKAFALQTYCFSCGGDGRRGDLVKLRAPDSYPRDVADLVEAFTTDGKAHICAFCKSFAGSHRRLREFAIGTALSELKRHPPEGLGDKEGALLIAALLTYAWAETNDLPDKEPTPALAAAIEILGLFPQLPLRAGECFGPLNIVTRDLGRGTSLMFTQHRDDELELLNFGSAEPQQGFGRAAFARLMEIADRHFVFLMGIVKANVQPGMDPSKIMNDAQLLTWYERFGFRTIGHKDGHAVIRRAPGPPHGYPYSQGDVA